MIVDSGHSRHLDEADDAVGVGPAHLGGADVVGGDEGAVGLEDKLEIVIPRRHIDEVAASQLVDIRCNPMAEEGSHGVEVRDGGVDRHGGVNDVCGIHGGVDRRDGVIFLAGAKHQAKAGQNCNDANKRITFHNVIFRFEDSEI